MSNKIEKTVTYTESVVDLADCPLCNNPISGILTSEIQIPDNKLGYTADRANVKVEPIAMDVIDHHCAKVQPREQGFVQRRTASRLRHRGGIQYGSINADRIASNRISPSIMDDAYGEDG